MTTFSRRPTLSPEEFDNQGASKPEPAPAAPSPNAPPTRAYNLRLNDYELAELDRIAQEQERSMQHIMRNCVRNYIRNHRAAKKAS